MSETLTIDPASEDSGNTPYELIDPASGRNVTAQEYPPPDRDQAFAASADTEGDPLVSSRYRNRQITVKVRLSAASAASLDSAIQGLQAKVGKVSREGGTLKRVTLGGSTIVFDLLDADVEVPVDWQYAIARNVECTVRFLARPYGRGVPVIDADHAETALPVCVFTVSGVPGDAPALGRLVIDDDQGQDQFWVTWGVESRNYGTASSAGLFFEAEALTPLGGGAGTAGGTAAAGYSGSGAILAGALATSYQAVLSSQASGGGAHWSHVGTFRAYARVQPGAGNAGGVSVALQWGEGDLRSATTNTPVDLFSGTATYTAWNGSWRLADLGLVAPSRVPQGSQQWQARLLAKSTTAGDDVYVDWLMLVPADEGSGVAAGVNPQIDYSSFQARDEFNQAAGPLTGKTPDTGGNWTAVAGSDADDFSVSGAGTATRTAVSDAATSTLTGRPLVLATPASLAGLFAQVNMSVSVGGNTALAQGLMLRHVDASNYLAIVAVPDVGGQAVFIKVIQRIGGTDTDITETTGGYGFWPYIFPIQSTDWTLAAYVNADGTYSVWWNQGGGAAQITSGYSSQLATGGTLASGKVGIIDWYTAAAALTRTYSGFYVYGSVADYAIPASQSLEVRHDRVIREDAAGATWQRPSSYKGDYLRLRPGTSRFIVKACRTDPAIGSDSAIDDISARLEYTPRYLVIPA